MSSVSSSRLARDVSRLNLLRILLCGALFAALGSVVRVPLLSYWGASSGQTTESSALAQAAPSSPAVDPEQPADRQATSDAPPNTAGPAVAPERESGETPVADRPQTAHGLEMASVPRTPFLPSGMPALPSSRADDLPGRDGSSRADAAQNRAAAQQLMSRELARWLAGTKRLGGEVAEEFGDAVHRWAAPTSTNGATENGDAASSLSMRLVLHNPLGSGGVVHYLVDDRKFSLYPGQWHELATQSARVVRFDGGDDFGERRLMVRSGVFAFQVSSARGWELVKQ